MNKEQEKKQKALQVAKEKYLSTEGIDALEKKGSAKEEFDKLVAASGDCWEEVHSKDATPEDHKEFREEFKELIKI